MTPDIEKIEHLLNAKSFGELSVAERELVLAHLSGVAEYEHMRETLLRVKKVFTAEAVAMQTDAQLKEQILNRFEQNKPKPSSPFAAISTFFQTLIPSATVRFASMLGLLVMIVGGSLFLFSPRKNELAQHIETQKSVPAPPPADSFENMVAALVPAEPSMAEEKPVSTKTESGMVSDDVRPVMMEKRATGEDMAEEIYVDQPYMAPGAAAQESNAPMQNQIYRNNDGYLQYQNSRVAESPVKTKDKTDAYKDYSSKAKKAEAADEKASQGNTEAESMQEISVKQEEKTLRGSRGVAQGKYAQLPSIPAWPGVEKDGSKAHTATTEKIKNYLREELVGSYKTDPRLESPLSIQVTFTEKGKVSAVEMKGQVSEAQKNAIVNKIKKMPAFKFTEGSNPVLVQNYVIIP